MKAAVDGDEVSMPSADGSQSISRLVTLATRLPNCFGLGSKTAANCCYNCWKAENAIISYCC